MKREILFRGKHRDTNEWVYGSPAVFRGIDDRLHHSIIQTDFTEYYLKDIVPVLEETIGQFTGLFDKNGQRIFENDIVAIDGEDGYFQITWSENEAMFRMESDGLSVDFDNFYSYEVEVIDNIYDNPELLEGIDHA